MTKLTLEKSMKLRIQKRAHRYVSAVRSQHTNYFNSFIQQFSLSSPQGLALMGLAEALIRVPDAATANALIYDKLSDQEWDQQFILHSPALSKLAASSLSLASHCLQADDDKEDIQNTLTTLLKQSGRPIIRAALKEAMKYLGQHFVCAESIGHAVKQSDQKRKANVTYSYDMLGEAALCHEDIDRYMNAYEQAIRTVAEDNKYKNASSVVGASVSIKLSALHTNFHGLKYDDVLQNLGDRFIILAKLAYELNVDITVDAEEADRQSLTLELFERCVAQPEFKGHHQLGIAVQAYSKKALEVLHQLADIARRYEVIIPIRLVKGAYWDYEIKQAQSLGLEDYPVFTHKHETDINYIACAQYLLSKVVNNQLTPRFATHNAYSLAAVIEIAKDQQYSHPIEIQRLYGMGEGLHDIVLAEHKAIISRVYSPVGNQQQLLPYLIRRLLENGANSSFIHQLFDPAVSEQQLLLSPFDLADENVASNTKLSILKPSECLKLRYPSAIGYAIRDPQQLENLLAKIRPYYSQQWRATPLIVDRNNSTSKTHTVYKPHDNTVSIGKVSFVSDAAVTLAINNAYKALHEWQYSDSEKRVQCLLNIADALQKEMPKFIALLQIEAGKILQDAIDEVREAIDFCRYYAEQMQIHCAITQQLPTISGETNTLSYEPKGIFVCISPWNFPLAIFTGQIVAALVTGNSVLAKPAEATSLIAYETVQLMYKAGIPKKVLQLIPGIGIEIGKIICADERIAGIAFTGSTRAAKQLQRGLAQREGAIATLIAETGGQNAMIVDSTALAEQVVKDVMQSAFYSAGQRCSALRVLYVQEDIADQTIALLKGAMQEIVVGNPECADTDVGPIIDNMAKQRLTNHMQELKKDGYAVLAKSGESKIKNGSFVSPILFQINRVSEIKEENFGPVLHLIRYKKEEIDQIIEDINQTRYGLTLGIHSRNQNFYQDISKRIRVGNVYINRNTIGARVGCQPFGGRALSGTGPKAGGENYIKRFMTEKVITINTSAIGGAPDLMK